MLCHGGDSDKPTSCRAFHAHQTTGPRQPGSQAVSTWEHELATGLFDCLATCKYSSARTSARSAEAGKPTEYSVPHAPSSAVCIVSSSSRVIPVHGPLKSSLGHAAMRPCEAGTKVREKNPERANRPHLYCDLVLVALASIPPHSGCRSTAAVLGSSHSATFNPESSSSQIHHDATTALGLLDSLADNGGLSSARSEYEVSQLGHAIACRITNPLLRLIDWWAVWLPCQVRYLDICLLRPIVSHRHNQYRRCPLCTALRPPLTRA